MWAQDQISLELGLNFNKGLLMYLSHFKLETYPFRLTPDTDFFTEIPVHQDALSFIKACLETDEGFIKITGEVGTGKTLLCRQLLRSLDSNQYITAYLPNPFLAPGDIYRVIMEDLGIALPENNNTETLIKTLTQHLIQWADEGKRIVIVVDEAQVLKKDGLEALRLLSNIETEKLKLVQIILFGQPELDTLLSGHDLRQLAQRIAFSFQITPLTPDELKLYISQRLSVAGYRGLPLFSDKTLSLIHKATNGIPRLINILCHKCLLASFSINEWGVSNQSLKKAVNDCGWAGNSISSSAKLNKTSLAISALFILMSLAIWWLI